MLLTGVLYNAGGPLASVTIVFTATRTTQNGVLIGSDASFTTQVDGTYGIDLEPGYYHVFWLEHGKRVRLGDVVADEFTQTSLPAALQASPMPVDSSALEDYIVESLATMRADLDASQSAVQQAQAAQADAESARDAATVAGQVYADTAAGLAAVGDGQYFKTPAASAEGFLTLYRNDAGSATQIETFPSLNGLTAAIRADNEKTTRLNRSFSLRPFAGESLRADFEAQAYGLGDTNGISRAVGEGEMFAVQRATPKWVFQPVASGAIQLVEVPPDTLAHEWDPVTGEYLGVLSEERRTNLIPDSNDFTAWSQIVSGVGVAPVITPGAAEGVDGTLSASRVVFDIRGSDGDSGDRSQIFEPSSTTIGETYTGSIWVKSATGESYDIRSDFNGAGAEVHAVGNEWTRIENPYYNSVDASRYFHLGLRGTTNPEIITSEYADVYIHFAQKEVGNFASSYTPTAGSAVTRDRGGAARTMGSEFNARTSTFIARGVAIIPNDEEIATAGPFLDRVNYDDFTGVIYNSSANRWEGCCGETAQVAVLDVDSGHTYGQPCDIAFSWDLGTGEFTLSVNGVSDTRDGATPSSKSRFRIFTQGGGAYAPETSTCKSIEYHPLAMTAAELEALTA